MVCEKVIGKLKDVDITGKTVEYVDIEWHEAFKKIHRKVTGQGREVGIRMNDSILTRGLFQDDVIYDADGVVIVVNTPSCEVIEVSLAPGHEKYVAKVCYEIGNRHAPLSEHPGFLLNSGKRPEKWVSVLQKQSKNCMQKRCR